jgi:hypothetical protein
VPPPESSEARRSESGSGRQAVTVEVSPDDVTAYNDDASTRVARMARVAPVLFESSVKLPKLGPDGERLGTSEQ